MQFKTDALNFQEKQYAKTASTLVGQSYDFDKWQKSGEQKAYLEKQSKQIAEKLYEGYRHHGLGWSRIVSVNPYANIDLYICGLFSKGVKKLDNYRNISIIPVKGRQQRNGKNKELQYFLSQNPHTRMWLFTDKRTTLVYLRDVLQRMHRKLSKLNNKKFMKLYGARFVFRTSELGEIIPLGQSDVSVHPHMHALLVLDGKLTKKQFIALNTKIKHYWKAYSADSGIIKNPRELTKYVVKPNDMDALNAQQTIKLYKAQQGLHLVQPLQDLKNTRRKIREDNQKVIIRKGTPKLVHNWNRSTSPKKQTDPFKEYVEMLDDTQKADTLRECGLATPRIVAWCAPAPVFTPISEPLFLVHGLKGRDPIPMFEREEVIRMQEAINVHTNTLTVPTEFQKNSQQRTNYESTTKIPPKDRVSRPIHEVLSEPF